MALPLMNSSRPEGIMQWQLICSLCVLLPTHSLSVRSVNGHHAARCSPTGMRIWAVYCLGPITVPEEETAPTTFRCTNTSKYANSYRAKYGSYEPKRGDDDTRYNSQHA
eukprot:5394885-Pleurochrysis_carterae.AAC.1